MVNRSMGAGRSEYFQSTDGTIVEEMCGRQISDSQVRMRQTNVYIKVDGHGFRGINACERIETVDMARLWRV